MTSTRTFVIAEAGANHNRNFGQALALIDAAVEARADAVKFQTYTAETLYSKHTPDFYNYKNITKLIKDIELPREWQKDLKAYCDEVGIEFMSSPFDEKAVDELVALGVKRIKIAGFESSDPRFVRMVASTGLPLVISAGIGSNVETVANLLEWVSMENSRPDVTILHCNNAYPTPFEDINLLQIPTLRAAYPEVRVGLSDHTPGILAPPLAVALGASCVEKHYTLSQRLPGPDHIFAIEPLELQQMVSNIRTAETCLNRRTSNLTPSEENMKTAMRSIIATRPLVPGEVLTTKNITTKRPFLEESIPASDFYEVLGRVVTEEVAEDSILSYSLLDTSP
jgi:sialic acid synthase SpsE